MSDERERRGPRAGYPPLRKVLLTAEQALCEQVDDREDHSAMIPTRKSVQARSSNRALQDIARIDSYARRAECHGLHSPVSASGSGCSNQCGVNGGFSVAICLSSSSPSASFSRPAYLFLGRISSFAFPSCPIRYRDP